MGNVLGDPSFPAAASGGNYEIESDGYSYAKATIYQLGYPNMGNNGYTAFDAPKNPNGLDAKVKSTLLRYKNYDYFNKAVRTDSTGIPDLPLPASLTYASQPAWWPSGTPWPPIGPDVQGYANKIPAQARFESGIP